MLDNPVKCLGDAVQPRLHLCVFPVCAFMRNVPDSGQGLLQAIDAASIWSTIVLLAIANVSIVASCSAGLAEINKKLLDPGDHWRVEKKAFSDFY